MSDTCIILLLSAENTSAEWFPTTVSWISLVCCEGAQIFDYCYISINNCSQSQVLCCINLYRTRKWAAKWKNQVNFREIILFICSIVHTSMYSTKSLLLLFFLFSKQPQTHPRSSLFYYCFSLSLSEPNDVVTVHRDTVRFNVVVKCHGFHCHLTGNAIHLG